jgi:hypothetical protein
VQTYRESLLAAHLPEREVDTKTLGKVTLRGLTAHSWHRLTEQAKGQTDLWYPAALVQLSIVDPDTKELAFTHADIPAIQQFHGPDLIALATAAKEVNGIGKAGAEDVAKNSETSPNDSSS